jgi:superfamily II DNA/RNA helicase
MLAGKGITKLFPIQSAAFDAILKGTDMIGRGLIFFNAHYF